MNAISLFYIITMTSLSTLKSECLISGFKVSWESNVARIIRDRRKEIENNTIIESCTYNHLTEASANKAMLKAKNIPPFLVGLVGIPGSGKTTSSMILSSLLSDGETSIGNIIVPMDGYHYPLSTLRSFPNAEDAIYRRGAPDTFDSNSFRDDLKRIKQQNDINIEIPGFDHAKGDPEPGAQTFVRGDHDVVICEGLYLLHDLDGWDGIAELFDLTVFLDSGVDECIKRLKERNKCIPGYTAEEIEIRCDAVDKVNASTVQRSRVKADLVVQSVTGI